MKVTNIRSGRILRVTVVVLLLIPILYLLASWSGHNKVTEIYNGKYAAHKSSSQIPILVSGKI